MSNRPSVPDPSGLFPETYHPMSRGWQRSSAIVITSPMRMRELAGIRTARKTSTSARAFVDTTPSVSSMRLRSGRRIISIRFIRHQNDNEIDGEAETSDNCRAPGSSNWFGTPSDESIDIAGRHDGGCPNSTWSCCEGDME